MSEEPKTHGGRRTPGPGKKLGRPAKPRYAGVRPWVPVASPAEEAAIEALAPQERARRLLAPRPVLRATGPDGAWVKFGVAPDGEVWGRGHHPAGMTAAQMAVVGAAFRLLQPDSAGVIALEPVIAALEGAGYAVQEVEI